MSLKGFMGKIVGIAKKIATLGIFGGIAFGLYYLYTTGELLNLLNLLLSQDPLVLVIVSVVGLLGLALIMGGK